MNESRTFTAFAGEDRITTADVKTMLVATKEWMDRDASATILIFDDTTGGQIDFDFRGTAQEVVDRLSSHPSFQDQPVEPLLRTGPGRPKLGVVCREVSLLPRHWEWLAAQPGGASVALRKLVERARKENAEADRQRVAIDAAYRFMHALSGHEARFEEASRALFAGDMAQLRSAVARWPRDVRMHLLELVAQARPDALAQAPRAPTQAGPAR